MTFRTEWLSATKADKVAWIRDTLAILLVGGISIYTIISYNVNGDWQDLIISCVAAISLLLRKTHGVQQ